jgi:hypothetical protein
MHNVYAWLALFGPFLFSMPISYWVAFRPQRSSLFSFKFGLFLKFYVYLTLFYFSFFFMFSFLAGITFTQVEGGPSFGDGWSLIFTMQIGFFICLVTALLLLNIFRLAIRFFRRVPHKDHMLS